MIQERSLNKLDFPKITHHLAGLTRTQMAKNMALDLHPSGDLDQIRRWQEEVSQARQIQDQGKSIPIPRLEELGMAFKRLEIEASLNGRELAQIGQLLSTVSQVKHFFDQEADEDRIYSALSFWADQCTILPQVQSQIDQTVSEDGTVLSSASSELARIRRQQGQTENQIRTQLNQLLKSKANILSDALITIRNDRYVLPVKADFRGQLAGNIHDQSATGQTIYVEPQAVIDLNNRLSSLYSQEKAEIERLLYEISLELVPYLDALKGNQTVIGQLDFIQAKAEYGKELQATTPQFSMENQVALWQARHPLVDPDQVVANDILIGETYRVMLITGPNTGGKTIVLKTIGLIQLMGQAGLQVPCQEGSQLGIFDQIFADIGDEQSIEQNLSTFSSHMTNIVSIIESATYQSLILFDELGSGTDPQEGAALAMAILDHLRKIGAVILATTHYPELKVYGHKTPKTINAAMEFDVDSLSPTYHLMIGVPGRSNALEISRRLGLDPSILDQAKQGISQDSHSLNEMVAKLERERREASTKNQQAQDLLDQSASLLADLRTEYDRYLHQKADLIEKAKRQANEKVVETQKQAEAILQEIRDLQLVQGQNHTIKESVLIDKKSALDHLKQAEDLRKNKVLKKAKNQRRLKVGDDVEVLPYSQRGTIVAIDKEQYLVQMGILKMTFSEADLKLLTKVDRKEKINLHRQAGSKVKTTLDLRGERYDLAMKRLTQYLDQALLSNHPMVTIIHGKGTGALRSGVKKALEKHPQVDHFEYSPANAGGNGSTQVYFK